MILFTRQVLLALNSSHFYIIYFFYNKCQIYYYIHYFSDNWIPYALNHKFVDYFGYILFLACSIAKLNLNLV